PRAECAPERGRAAIQGLDELLRVQPVAALGRQPSCRRVRMRQEAERLELGELTAHGRRGHAQLAALDETLGADRLARRHVLLDDTPQNLPLSRRKLHVFDGSGVARRSSLTLWPRLVAACIQPPTEPVRRGRAGRHGASFVALCDEVRWEFSRKLRWEFSRKLRWEFSRKLRWEFSRKLG